METMIEINHVSMMFNKSSEKIDNLKEYVIKLFKGQLMFEEFWALKDIDLTIHKGEALGIIGHNGSGKSTLLKLIARVLKPTEGTVNVCGVVAPLIELGAGFDMDLSARENIFLNGAVLGYGRRQMNEKFDSIIEFAELWDFVDCPVKNFSSGMMARLGFAIATAYTPDILIVDEILGVGDYQFQKKCHARMQEIIDSGATIIFVSHAIDDIRRLCDRVVWLDHGKKVMEGDTQQICDCYMGV